MPRFSRTVPGIVAAALVAAAEVLLAAAPTPLKDVLDTPSVPSSLAQHGVVSSIARLGDRLVAVGPRGLVLLSADSGRTWNQVAAPVSADLVAVRFADDNTVWAVGHDAVALRSSDAGATWQRVLDGRSVLALLQSTYTAKAGSGDAAAQAILKDLERSMQQSATPGVLPAPFLDVWLAPDGEGYLIGAFGLILRTSDHGKTWTPWIENTDNDSRFHLYGISGAGDHLYLVGEQGLVLHLDRERHRFVKVATPYKGTFFGIDSQPGRVLVYGLRGNVYLSRDGGGQWGKIETGIDAHIVAAVSAGVDRLLLVSQAGHVLALKGASLKAQPLQVPFTTEVLGAASTGSRGLAFAQINGVRVVELAAQTLE